MTDRATICFDGWKLDPSSGELSREGQTQRLPPQPLAMLVELLAHPGQVVPRERLVQVLWPRGVVDFDNGLNALARKLRVALGDDADAPRYIETLPRIGFRFIGKLDRPSPDPAAERASRRAHVAWVALAAVVVAGAAGIGLWQFNRSGAATATTSPDADAPPRRPASERAYDLYLEARFHRSRRDIDGTDLAISSLESALREDPHFAEGWASLAETWTGAGMSLKTPVSEAFARSREAALRALELDDRLSPAHAALAPILAHYDRDFTGADAEYARALQLNDANGLAWHGLALLRAYQGRVPEAFEAIRRARELEPTTLLFSQNHAMLLYHSRRFDEAVALARSLLASQPRFDQARSVLIRSLVATDDAKAALEQLALRHTDRLSMSDAGLVYAQLGRGDEARAEIARLEKIGQQGFGMAYDIAVIHAALGDKAAGCAALERALGDHSLTLPWMRVDPRMDPLRDEPCFAEVSRRLYGS